MVLAWRHAVRVNRHGVSYVLDFLRDFGRWKGHIDVVRRVDRATIFKPGIMVQSLRRCIVGLMRGDHDSRDVSTVKLSDTELA